MEDKYKNKFYFTCGQRGLTDIKATKRIRKEYRTGSFCTSNCKGWLAYGDSPHPYSQGREGHWKGWALKLLYIKLTTYTT
jgi:hypothetical protein